MNYKRVAVLKGGWTSEREVSLMTAEGVEKTLEELGYDVLSIDVHYNLPELLDNILNAKPDVIFNALHGIGGEDGIIQGVLEMIGIPYTHSNVLASAVGMDKVISRQLFKFHGISVPDSCVVSFEDFKQDNPLKFPYVSKPVADGSTVGISIIRSDEDRQKALEQWNFGNEILIEKYIPGRDLFVPIINGKALGIIEVKSFSGFYDYETKYTDNKAIHISNPEDLPAHVVEKALRESEIAHRVLKCRGITRTDFRYDDNNPDDGLFMLELNTQPGLTPLSLVPDLAQNMGISFGYLVQTMIDGARCDNHAN